MDIRTECLALEKKVRDAGHPVAEMLRRANTTASQWQRYKNGIYVPKVTTWGRIVAAADELSGATQ